MIQHEMTYEDLDGNEVTETLSFHLSKTDIMELEVSFEGGVHAALLRMVEEKDAKALFNEFKQLLIKAYGVRSEDGRRFIKTEEQTQEFAQTVAFDELYARLATDDEFAADFIIGMLPRDFSRAIEANPEAYRKAKDELKAKVDEQLPPPVPVTTNQVIDIEGE